MVRRPLIGLMYQPQMINGYGEFSGMRLGKGNGSTKKKSALVSICPPQIPCDLTWDRIRAAEVESQ
jgi:hypothetical protein